VAVVGISAMDTAARVEDFSRKYGLSYLQLLDREGAYAPLFSSTGVIPRTLVLDAEQRIVVRELGYTEEKLTTIVAAVARLVGEPAAP